MINLSLLYFVLNSHKCSTSKWESSCCVIIIVTSAHLNLHVSTPFVVYRHFLSAKASPEWRLYWGFRAQKKCPFSQNRGVPSTGVTDRKFMRKLFWDLITLCPLNGGVSFEQRCPKGEVPLYIHPLPLLPVDEIYGRDRLWSPMIAYRAFSFFLFFFKHSLYLKYGHHYLWEKRSWLISHWHKLRTGNKRSWSFFCSFSSSCNDYYFVLFP